jgi:hypothetical protein
LQGQPHLAESKDSLVLEDDGHFYDGEGEVVSYDTPKEVLEDVNHAA